MGGIRFRETFLKYITYVNYLSKYQSQIFTIADNGTAGNAVVQLLEHL
jgi:hypothetical protein